jgi:AraC-like DNA-binding protein
MTVFNLPDDIFLNKTELDSPIIIHHYIAAISHLKEKSILHRNAVSLVISGQKTIRFAEASVDTNDKEIHFLSSGNSISSFDIANQREFESILIFFDDKVLTDFSISNETLIDERQKKYRPASSRYISFQKDDFITNYIQSMLIIVSTKKQFSAEIKTLKLWELLLYLLENHSQTFLAFLNRDTTMLHHETVIRKVVEANMTENLSIDEMAFLCNVSTSTFKRQFRKIYRTSPASWFAKQKMKPAAQLLTKHKKRPSEIWFKLGYETHTSFTKSFKKHFGVSPNLLRKTDPKGAAFEPIRLTVF